MKRPRFARILSTLLALCLSLPVFCMVGCQITDTPTTDPHHTSELTSEPTPKPDSGMPPESASTHNTNKEDAPVTEPEVFKPDPTHSVPQYDAIMADLAAFPIRFTYNKVQYQGFADFVTESESYTDIDRGIESTLVLRHADIPAAFKLVARVFPEEKAYEYAVYITNDGMTDTAVFSDLHYEIDFLGDAPVLSGLQGDADAKYYTPYECDLTTQGRFRDRSNSGRPSHSVFPYYNLSYGNGGTFIAIGWPGTWYAYYTYSRASQTTNLKTGQLEVATYIAPGETLRTPLMAFVEYEGLTRDEQANAWRHYYIEDVMRDIHGEKMPTYTAIGGLADGKNTDYFIEMIKTYQANGLSPDLLWVDAGWYTGAAGETVSWPMTGTMDMDTSRFPDKMANIGTYTATNDMTFMLWFEPENVRVNMATFLRNQPDFEFDWFLGVANSGTWLQGRVLNLGDPDCREWVFNKICTVIDTAGVTAFRQDFNNDPASTWAVRDRRMAKDGMTRTGMTENFYVQGYLALWDALIEKYGFLMDSCASGGGRNDLESMKRAVPLHYTDWFDGNNEDYNMKGRINQVLFAWFPYFKNELYECTDIYKARMNYAAMAMLKMNNFETATSEEWAILKQAYDEYELVRDYFYADYYALTDWSSNPDRWDARMFYDPTTASGFASVACYENSTKLTNTIKLKGLDPARSYTVTDLDGLVSVTATGRQLMDEGIAITVPKDPYCAILMIKS